MLHPVYDAPMLPTRRRPIPYLLAVLIVIAAGLLLRSGVVPLPSGLVKYGGVALWASMIFLGLALILRQTSTTRLTIFALVISWAVEFLQLYRAPWIDVIRATRPGHLILGSTFNSPDLPAYFVGVLIGAILDRLLINRHASSQTPIAPTSTRVHS
jgi:hypothetical protein